MAKDHQELLYSIAAACSWAFIGSFAFWLFAVTPRISEQDAGLWFAILFVLSVGAVIGAGYLFWWIVEHVKEEHNG